MKAGTLPQLQCRVLGYMFVKPSIKPALSKLSEQVCCGLPVPLTAHVENLTARIVEQT